jgi:DNA repair exonuclease SbcCD ATPase subunit
MPHSGEDDENDEPEFGLIMERSAASSTVSMEDAERLDALRKVNDELRKKLVDTERTLQRRLEEHEHELEDLQDTLDEARSELTASKRDEKELRSKEVRMYCICLPESVLIVL